MQARIRISGLGRAVLVALVASASLSACTSGLEWRPITSPDDPPEELHRKELYNQNVRITMEDSTVHEVHVTKVEFPYVIGFDSGDGVFGSTRSFDLREAVSVEKLSAWTRPGGNVSESMENPYAVRPYPRPKGYRDRWYTGIALGGGQANYYLNLETSDPSARSMSEQTYTLQSVRVTIARGITNNRMIGIDYEASTAYEFNFLTGGYEPPVQFTRVNLWSRYFLFNSGFNGRAGFGYMMARGGIRADGEGTKKTEYRDQGVNLIAAVGYEFFKTKRRAFGIEYKWEFPLYSEATLIGRDFQELLFTYGFYWGKSNKDSSAE